MAMSDKEVEAGLSLLHMMQPGASQTPQSQHNTLHDDEVRAALVPSV